MVKGEEFLQVETPQGIVLGGGEAFLKRKKKKMEG